MSNARTLASLIDGSNIVVPSGFGLDFSASANVSGMTSEVLDDYEEGTWTATFTGTTDTATGFYTKVGRVVNAYVYSSSLNVTSSTYAIIGGLPFAINSSNSAGSISHNTYASNAENGYAQNNQTNFFITEKGNYGATLTITGDPKYIMMSVSYFTNS